MCKKSSIYALRDYVYQDYSEACLWDLTRAIETIDYKDLEASDCDDISIQFPNIDELNSLAFTYGTSTHATLLTNEELDKSSFST